VRALVTASFDPASLARLVQFMRQHHQVVVIDGLHTLDDHAVAVLDTCDRVLLVVTQEVPAVRHAQRCVSFLKRLGQEPRLQLIVNRFSPAAEVKAELISETVGLPVAATLASDYPAMVRSINRGRLLIDDAPRSPLAKDLEGLTSLLAGHEQAEPVATRPGLLKRLFGARTAHAG